MGGLGWPRPPQNYPRITPKLPPELPQNYPAFVVISDRVGDHWVALPVLRIWPPKWSKKLLMTVTKGAGYPS